ncbi:MAG: ATP-binding protein [Bacteroidetes bacterium]|nr:ATP-binding protein [Bacteroidota bacterium]
MNKLIMAVGLPLSGKSTWAKERQKPMVNPDSIRLALHGQAYIAEAEPHVWAIARTMVRALFIAGHQIVILDATNTTEKRRKEWESPNEEWVREFVVVRTPKARCIERAATSGRKNMIPIIECMAKTFTVPTTDELLDDEGIEFIGEQDSADHEKWV